jgi:hypothetical protein
MKTRAWLVVCVSIVVAASAVRAAQPLSLGQGTACVLMAEREAKAMLGTRKRHVLACAGPTGTVVRVVISRKGTVECTDAVQVGGDGSTSTAGPPCRAVTTAHEGTVPPVVNLTGAWITDVDSLIGPVHCLSQVEQDGAAIYIGATCDIGGEFTGNGTIDFEGYAFTSQGSAQVPVYGYCAAGSMAATVGPDGQSMSGTLACDGLIIPFTAHRP